MGLEQLHPQRAERSAEYVQLCDTHKGEQAVKAKGETYLPSTGGMQLDGMGHEATGAAKRGQAAYDAYRKRAVYHNYMRAAVEAMVGVMHQEPARFELPASMQGMIESASAMPGESLQMFLMRINAQQLQYGGCGILPDIPTGQSLAELRPYLSLYARPAIGNWDDGAFTAGVQRPLFVILDESDSARTAGLSWEFQRNFKVLALEGMQESLRLGTPGGSATGKYSVCSVVNSTEIGSSAWVLPSIGGSTLNYIPFVCCNLMDLMMSPVDPPLMDLSNLCLAIYRGEADHRYNLHMLSQDTLVRIGVTDDDAPGEPPRIGAGGKIDVPRGCDAKFIGVSAAGLTAQASSIDGDKMAACAMALRIFESDKGSGKGANYASGAALTVRGNARTATMRMIALTGAAALQQSLRHLAIWMGEDPRKVSVQPNTKFVDDPAASKTFLELMQGKLLGGPLTLESIHRYLRRQDLTEKTFEQEMDGMKEEPPVIAPAQAAAGAKGGLGGSTGGAPVRRGA